MSEYKVVKRMTSYGLESDVNALIKDGWKPQGSVVHTASDFWGIGEQYTQAMFKEDV